MRICFVSLNAYPLLTGINLGFVAGGAEKRLVILAKEVVKCGFEVYFITYGNGDDHIEYINGIKIIKVYRREDVHRFNALKKAIHIWNALKEAAADIYLESPGLTGIVSLFCRLKRKVNILSIASDGYVTKQLKMKSKPYSGWLLKLSIRLASDIVVQSDYQRNLLYENFGRESIVIKNPCPLYNDELPNKQLPPLILWVAELRRSKQAELFLELAKLIPEAQFEMIGGVALGEEEYYLSIQEAICHIPNLNFLGFIPQQSINQYYEQASILVSTSIVEGFPNTFLEAWATYTPVVSLNIDPDEIICRLKLGFHSRDFHRMVDDTKILLNNKDLRDEIGRNGRNYVEREHDIDTITNKYAILFRSTTYTP